MKFRILYSNSFNDIISKLDEKYNLELSKINKKNILEVYYKDETIYTTKDNFNNIKIDLNIIIEKIEFYLKNKNNKGINLNNNLDDLEVDEY